MRALDFTDLPSLRRDTRCPGTDLRRHLTEHWRNTPCPGLLPTATGWAAGTVSARAGRELARIWAGPGACLTLRPHHPSPGPSWILWLENALAVNLVDLMLGGEGRIGVPSQAGLLQESGCGMLAYLFARWLSDAELPVRVCDAHAVVSAGSLDALADTTGLLWHTGFKDGQAQGLVGLWMPDATPVRGNSDATAPSWLSEEPTGQLPDWALDTDLQVTVLAGRVQARARQLAELCVGDLLELDLGSLHRGLEGLQGHCKIAVVGTALEAHCALDTDRLTLKEALLGREPAMTDASHEGGVPNRDLVAALGDAPVQMSIELARLQLPLRDLCQLTAGDILHTDTPVGSQVELRCGQLHIGSGELVEVEGQLGVRLTRVGAEAVPVSTRGEK